MEMDYDFTPAGYQQLQDPAQPPVPVPASTHPTFQNQYIGHPYAQPQGQFHGYNFPATTAASHMTHRESDSSSLLYGDGGMHQSPGSGQANPCAASVANVNTAVAAHAFGASSAPFTSHGIPSGTVIPAGQIRQHQLRHSASSASFTQRPLSHTAGDDGKNFAQEKNMSSGEEKDDTVQSRRKAQNRAAQRAFRERKEQRVRDLEQELAEYKQKLTSIMESNEMLKQQIQKVNTENEILKATSEHHRRRSRHRRHRHHSGSQRSSSCSSASEATSNSSLPSLHYREPTETGPLRYAPMDYAPEKPAYQPNICPVTGERLLSASETWDMIVQTLESRGLDIDVQSVQQKLSLHVTCNGKGPVIQESRVKAAIEESILEHS
ncbi:hypothetical protein KEM52_000195 [Ascosphaera acerosa]|nr:hypothetical protein KEM52_000195 [Ascosphaera acerosa]